MPPLVSLMIVADHRLFGELLASVLDSCQSFKVLAVVQSEAEALRQMQQEPPDVILIDVSLPNMIALSLTQQLTYHSPQARVLLLGVTESETDIGAYVEAGANGYVLKDNLVDELAATIERVACGETLCSPQVAHEMFARLSKLAHASDRSAPQELMILTARELEIVQLIAEGWTNRRIGDHLYLSPHTVKNHVSKILKKLRVQRRLEAVKYATDKRWLHNQRQ